MSKPVTVGMTSLGCSKNLVDSEVMLGLIENESFLLVDDFNKADVLIVNTCAFIESAIEESIQTILEMAEYKTSGICKCLIVTGCLAERYREEIIKEIPEVDGVLGTKAYTEILSCISKTMEKQTFLKFEGQGIQKREYEQRMITTGTYTAFLKIAEGCDNHCTYCIIPKLRGKYESRPLEDVIAEAKRLEELGMQEIIVIAQDSSYYGMDLYGQRKLATLLKELSSQIKVPWIRVHYCYPEQITEELIEAFSLPNICAYMDMPIQHCNNRILKRMGRHTTKEEILSTIELLRQKIPNIAIRTSIIAGFPGETEEEFEELKEFIKTVRFDRLGVFAYSQEEDTPAAKLPEQIPQEVKEKRRDTLMEIQKEISLEDTKKWIGKTIPVLVEGHDGLLYFGRSERDSVDIDCKVFFGAPDEVPVGSFIPVKILNTDEYDLIGEADYEFTK